MKPNHRACIAYIAGCLIANKKSSAVYDYSQSKYINLSGDVSAQSVNIYDYDQGCYLSGNGLFIFVELTVYPFIYSPHPYP